MKTRIVLILLLFASAAFLLLFSGPLFESRKNHASNYDGDIFPKERMKLERMMLADPATGKIPDGIRLRSIEFAQTLPGSYSKMKNSNASTLANKWNRRGPHFTGGRTRALGIDVLDENVIIAGGVSGGLWRSTDGGATWQKTTRPDQLPSVSCLAQDTRQGKENIWYAGTGEIIGNSADIHGDGIYKTTDGGKSWLLLENTKTDRPGTWDNKFEYVWRVVVDHTAPVDQDIVYAATALGGIYRSTDGGEEWAAVLAGYGNDYSIFTELDITPSGALYATMSEYSPGQSSRVSGIFRSEDGTNWVNITPEFMPGQSRRIVLAHAPSDENQVYFLAETPDAGKLTTNSRGDSIWTSIWKYTYVSGDGTGEGGIWENRAEFIPKPEKVRWHMNPQFSYNLVIAVKPDDPNTVFIGGTNLYRSTDGFTSDNWTLIGGTCPDPDDECEYHYRYPEHHADIHAVTFLPSDPNIMFPGTDGGVHKTSDVMAPRIEWENLNIGYYTTQFYGVAIDHAEGASDEIIGGTQDNGTMYTYTNDINVPYTFPSRGDGLTCLIRDGGGIYYTSQNTSTNPVKVKIWRVQLDETGNILTKTRIDPEGGRDFIWNNPIILDKNDDRIMYVGGGHYVWRNSNVDEIPFVDSDENTTINWDSLTHTRTDTSNPIVTKSSVITAMDVSKDPANVLYYGTSTGEVFRINGANEGDPEVINITGDRFQTAFCSNIHVDPDNADDVLVTFSNYGVISIFHSTDGGESWTPVSGNLEQYPTGVGDGPGVYWVETIKIDGEKLYLAGTTTGLYFTTDLDGEYTIWQQEAAEEIGNMIVRMIDVRHHDNYVAVGTHGAGIFDARITSLPPKPQSPSLREPADGTRGVLDYVNLKWQETDAPLYKLEIASDPEFNNIIQTEDYLKTAEFRYGKVGQGLKDFYWRVIAKNSSGESLPSEAWKFTSAVAAPELIYPEHNDNDIGEQVTLVWDPSEGAQEYHLQVTDGFVFTDMIIDTVISNTEYLFENLKPKTRYRWRVSAIESGYEGNFSSIFFFRTLEWVGVDDQSLLSESRIKIYPNPAAEYVNISVELPASAALSFEMTDIDGNKVKSASSGFVNSGVHKSRIDVTKLSSGKYFLRIKAGREIYIKPVMIVR